MTCRFKLAEGEVFSHIGIYKNDKKDNGNHLAYFKGTLEEPEKWLKEDSKYSYELWSLNHLILHLRQGHRLLGLHLPCTLSMNVHYHGIYMVEIFI